jgi:DNA-binding transcriptional regulator PaaX
MLYTIFVRDDIRDGSFSTTLLQTIYDVGRSISLGEIFSVYKKVPEKNIRVVLWRLEKKGMIERKNDGFVVSPIGKKHIESRQQPKQWDKKWRIITFDVPEPKRTDRIWLRTQFLQIGYETVQRSIFIGKNPIPQFIMEEIYKRKILPYIQVIVVGNIYQNSTLPEKK